MKLQPPAYYTYIVECSDGSYYTGKTYDLSHRVKQHNGLLQGGAKYTEHKRPVRLVYSEKYDTNTFACHREAEIKKLTRQQKKQLIDGL
jgi:putative endonuclease